MKIQNLHHRLKQLQLDRLGVLATQLPAEAEASIVSAMDSSLDLDSEKRVARLLIPVAHRQSHQKN